VPFFVCGDVNINLLHHKIALPIRNYISTCSSYGCLQLITNPTRITPSSCTLIDHIYTNFPTEKLTPGILINDLSDHLPVFVLIKTKPLQKWKSKKYTKHDYSKFDSETFVTKVQETLNQLQIDQNKPSEALDLGILCLNRYLKEQAPVKQLTKSKKRLAHKPWITTGLLRSIKTKNNLYRALVRSRFKNQNAHEKYKKYRNKVTRLLEESKRSYYQSQTLSCGNDSKKMWNLINNLLGSKGKELSPPEKLFDTVRLTP